MTLGTTGGVGGFLREQVQIFLVPPKSTNPPTLLLKNDLSLNEKLRNGSWISLHAKWGDPLYI